MNFSNRALKLISIIENAGYDVYAVGGCVRDYLLNRSCDDIDFASSATPFEMEKLLSENGIKYIETGIKHGTVTAIVENCTYEITTFRRDGEYFDSRHPDNVSFVRDIETDLSRRDFTVNALAFNNKVGLVDLFNGSDDLKKGIIKTVGDPDRRFNEDALRIMRAIRFASVLGFTIEENTKASIFRNKELLNNVSAERLFAELSKLLVGDNACKVLMEYREVIAVFIHELMPCFDCQQNTKWHIYDVWEHICHSVEKAPKDVGLRLTMLFHDVGKPQCKTNDAIADHFFGHPEVSCETAEKILNRLKASNELKDRVCTLIKYHDAKINPNKKSIKRWLSKLGENKFFDLLKVKLADNYSQNLELTVKEISIINEIEAMARKIITENEAFSVKDLKVNGFDLLNLGIKGQRIGEILNELISLVIDDKLPNEKEILIDYVKNDLEN